MIAKGSEHCLQADTLTLGVCYYPEHWEERLWREDLQRMKAYGLSVIRVAEFSWSLMEPKEGQYDFSFWDHFLDLAEEEGMQVIFCTPTATPPAWLTEHYPEVLNADGDGHLLYHGLRRHYNLTSRTYLELCGRLIEQMAKHFQNRSCIIGWQLDNEINCEVNEYYAESDHQAFRDYLKERYQTLDHLNEKLGTVFWSQTYTAWEQLHLARRTTCGLGKGNPHLLLEQKRFVSHSVLVFFVHQARILRPWIGDRFLTTNGIFADVDYHALMEAGLDFIMYDNYPNFAYELGHPAPARGEFLDRNTSLQLSKIRSISPVFGIMEQQSGPGGWNFRMLQPAPKPGQMRLWTLQAIAHGADYVSYFRWRTCTVGTEIYWHGLNDYSNQPNRRLSELEQIKQDTKTLAPVTGQRYRAVAAILTDYDNTWDGELDQWHGPLNEQSVYGWFTALQKAHIPFDFVDIRDVDRTKEGEWERRCSELRSYSLVVYPHPTILTKERVELLTAYVTDGGRLIMGCRSGYKDRYGRCPMQPMPGEAAELCGVSVKDFTFLAPGEEGTVLWEGERIPAPIFHDILEPAPQARVEAVFDCSYYSGSPALVSHAVGKGSTWYFGAGFAEETAAALLRHLGLHSPIEELLQAPDSVEIALRGSYLFVLNYTASSCEIVLKRKMTESLSGEEKNGALLLPAYGVMVFDTQARK